MAMKDVNQLPFYPNFGELAVEMKKSMRRRERKALMRKIWHWAEPTAWVLGIIILLMKMIQLSLVDSFCIAGISYFLIGFVLRVVCLDIWEMIRGG